MRKMLAILLLLWSVQAVAGLTLSPGTGAHTHANANTGGSTLRPNKFMMQQDVTSSFDSAAWWSLSWQTGGLHLGAFPPVEGYVGVGAYNNNGGWINDETGLGGNGADYILYGGLSGCVNGWSFYIDSNVPAGAFTPTCRFTIDTNGNVGVKGTLSTTKPCATGYTRVGPNYCAASAFTGNAFVVTGPVGCAQSTAIPNLTDAKAIKMEIRQVALTTNTLNATDQAVVSIAGPADTTCTTILQNVIASAKEFVALAATQLIQVNQARDVVTNVSGQFYFSSSASSVGATNVGYAVGYYD